MDNLNQNQLAQLHNAVSQQQMALSEKVGALKATDFIKKLVTVTEIKMMAEIKETKEYKGLQLFDGEGKLVTVTTWEQFCKYLGHSREKIDQDILNLSTLGEDFLETSQRMGLGYRDLRKLRKLPEDEQTIIIDSKAVAEGDADALKEMLEDALAKHAKEKHAFQAQLAEKDAEAQAKDQILADKNKKIDELDAKLSLRKQPDQAKLVAEETQAQILEDLASASNSIYVELNHFNNQIITLRDQASEATPHLVEKINSELGLVYNRIADLAASEGIEIDLANLIKPEWAQDVTTETAN